MSWTNGLAPVPYGRLWIKETAFRVRAEILGAVLARAKQVQENLLRWRQRLDAVGRLFLAKDPAFRSSERAALGRSAELLPVESGRPGELGTALADTFCSERRLASLDRRLQEEVLAAHGGLAAVMAREPRFLAEVVEKALFHRVAGAAGHWLKGQDAATVLHQRAGSIDGVVAELMACYRSSTSGLAERPGQRLTVALPRSRFGRSLRESLALALAPAALPIANFVKIPDDIVLCLEWEEWSFTSVAAALFSAQAWLAELAPKLVTRNDVAWTELSETAEKCML